MIIFEVLFDFIDFEEYNILKNIKILWNIYILWYVCLTIDEMSIHHRSFAIEDRSVVTDLILRNYLIATD